MVSRSMLVNVATQKGLVPRQHRKGKGNSILVEPVASADPGSAVVTRLCFLQSSFLKVLNGAE